MPGFKVLFGESAPAKTVQHHRQNAKRFIQPEDTVAESVSTGRQGLKPIGKFVQIGESTVVNYQLFILTSEPSSLLARYRYTGREGGQPGAMAMECI